MSCKTDEMKREVKRSIGQIGSFGKKALKWCKDNPEAVGYIVSGLGMGAIAVAGSIIDAKDRKHNEKIARGVLNPETGQLMYMKRDLNGIDLKGFTDRISSGMTRFEALQDMNLLK